MGSANISNNGLALTENYNYELAKKIDRLDDESILYFKKILDEADLVTEEIYNQFKEELAKLKPLEKIKEPIIRDSKKDFLISALPMSYSIEEFFKIYSRGFNGKDRERVACAIHDAELYHFPEGLSKDEFIFHLKKEFFKSPFIIKLLSFIDKHENGLRFGGIKEWIQNNCVDVPVPSRRKLTGNVQVLYEWIVELSDGKYGWDRPNYTQVMRRLK
jgi:hypothetical protein